MNPLSLRRHTFRGSALITAADALAVPAGLIAVIYLTRRFGPERFGIFTLAYSIAAWLEWTIASFFSRATIRSISQTENDGEVAGSLVRVQALTGIAAGVALWIGADLLAASLDEPALAPALRLFAFEVPLFTVAQAYRHIQVGFGRFSRRAAAAATRTISRLIILIILIEAGLSIEGAILSGIGASILELFIAGRGVKVRLGSRRSIGEDLWQVGVPTFLFAVCARSLDRLDLWLLKFLGASTAEAGLYGAAQNAGRIPLLLTGSLAPLVLASVSRLLREGRHGEADEISIESLRVVFLLTPFAACGAACAEGLIPFAFGREYAEAWPYAATLVFAAMAMLLLFVVSSILTAHGRAWLPFVVSASLVPLAALGCLLAIPRYGAFGAATVTMTVSTAAAALGLLLTARSARVAVPVRLLVRCAILSGFLFMVIRMIDPRGAAVLVALLAGWSAAAAVLLATRDLDLRELAHLARPSPPDDVAVTGEE